LAAGRRQRELPTQNHRRGIRDRRHPEESGEMTAPWVEAVAAIVRGTPRLLGALCRERAELFDGDDDQGAREAAELCGDCPAREPCAAWADSLRHNQINGIIAGQRRQWVSHPSVRRPKSRTHEGTSS
jgi:WhiB family transcriptional regulator, redox-sensing transcriptional regulator